MRTECQRENPWHLRHPNTFHYQWFKNLQELHRLTEEWAKRFSDQLPRIPALLSTLEFEIQETSPEEFLSELQYVVWKTQVEFLQTLYRSYKNPKTSEDLSSEEIAQLLATLEDIAIQQGALCAQSRWKDLPWPFATTFPFLLQALKDSPFFSHPRPYLSKRLLDHQAEIELKHCPHHSPYAEVKPIAHSLCKLHASWLLGFTLALNPKVRMNYHSTSQPHTGTVCKMTWSFV